MSQLAKLRDDIQALHTRLEAHIGIPAEERQADFKEVGEKIVADISSLEEQFRTERAMADAAERVGAALRQPDGKRVSGLVADEEARDEARKREPMLRRFALSEQVAEYRRNPKDKTAPFEVKTFFGAPSLATPEERAVIYGGALAADMVRPQLLAGVVRGNEPIGTRAIRDVLLNGRMSSDSVTFVKENVFTNAAAATAEATLVSDGAKPESSLTFSQVTTPAEVIAHWIPITRQALDDVPMLQSYVEGRLIDGLRREENDQLLNGDGTAPNISGILDQSGLQNLDQTYFTGAAVLNVGATPENFQRVLRGKTLVMTTGDSTATFAVINPTDWENFIARVDGDLNFYGPGPFSADTLPRLWGLDVVVTEDKAAGSVLVGDGTGAQVWDRWDARVLIADQHSDFFVRNLFVLLAEERLALAVYRPAAFALVDLA